MRRVTPIPQQDASCAAYRPTYKTMADFDRLGKPFLLERMDTIGGITGDRVEQLKNSRDVADGEMYRNALTNLQELEVSLSQTIACVNKDILQRNEVSSRLYTLQQEIEELRKEAEAKKQTVKEAKERSNQLENPYDKTTWWETWFPLGRPIRKENVPVLLSVSILMVVFSLAIFLRAAGLEIRLESFQSTTNSIFKNINPGKYQ